MGCCWSSSGSHVKDRIFSDNDRQRSQAAPPSNGVEVSAGQAVGGVPHFAEFSLADLKAATNNISSDFIVSESGEKAPNVVYKGRLQNRRWIAVKKFTKAAWPDPKQFAVKSLFSLPLLLSDDF
uniref:Uncharacterized protein n=1 Tax=Kalanchoe fedtschenkoi TaxID=63787 RepID=A0A7N0VA30_KALFE